MDELQTIGELLKNPTVSGLIALIILVTSLMFLYLTRALFKTSDALIKSTDNESEAIKSRDQQIERLINTIIDGQKELSGNIKENTEATREFMKLLTDNRSQIDKHDADSVGRTNELKAAVNQIGIKVADVGGQLRRNTDELIANMQQAVTTNSDKIQQMIKQVIDKLPSLSTSEQAKDIKNQLVELQATVNSMSQDVSELKGIIKATPEPQPLQAVETEVKES